MLFYWPSRRSTRPLVAQGSKRGSLYSLNAPVTVPVALLGRTRLTSVSSDSVHNCDVGAKPPNLLDHVPDLQGQLIGGSQAEALERK